MGIGNITIPQIKISDYQPGPAKNQSSGPHLFAAADYDKTSIGTIYNESYAPVVRKYESRPFYARKISLGDWVNNPSLSGLTPEQKRAFIDANDAIQGLNRPNQNLPPGATQQQTAWANAFAHDFKINFNRDPVNSEMLEAVNAYGDSPIQNTGDAMFFFKNKYGQNQQPQVDPKTGEVTPPANPPGQPPQPPGPSVPEGLKEIEGYIDYLNKTFIYPTLTPEEVSAREKSRNQYLGTAKTEAAPATGLTADEEKALAQIDEWAASSGNTGQPIHLNARNQVAEDFRRQKERYDVGITLSDLGQRRSVDTARQTAIGNVVSGAVGNKWSKEAVEKANEFAAGQNALSRSTERDIASASDRAQLLGSGGQVAGNIIGSYVAGKALAGKPLFSMAAKTIPTTQVGGATYGGGAAGGVGLAGFAGAHPFITATAIAAAAYQIPGVRRAVKNLLSGRGLKTGKFFSRG